MCLLSVPHHCTAGSLIIDLIVTSQTKAISCHHLFPDNLWMVIQLFFFLRAVLFYLLLPFLCYALGQSISLIGSWLAICHLFVCRIVSPLFNIFSGTFLIQHYFSSRYSVLCMCLGIEFPFDLLAKHKVFVLLLLSLFRQVLAHFSNSSSACSIMATAHLSLFSFAPCLFQLITFAITILIFFQRFFELVFVVLYPGWSPKCSFSAVRI